MRTVNGPAAGADRIIAVTVLGFAFLVVAGVAGGLTGSIAGLASLATYSGLLAFGLTPFDANVTNTVALTFTTVGSFLGSRPELRGQAPFLRPLFPVAVLGGVIGAALLLSTPAGGFEKVVPFLLGVASLTILIPRRVHAGGTEPTPSRRSRVLRAVGLCAVAIYGGYFGAAAGVLLLALLLHTTRLDLPRANAAKNVLLGSANLVAAIAFVFLAPVDWAAVVPLGLGCLIGARLGPVVVRRSPPAPLRWLIGAAGLALAVRLGFEAF